MAPKLMIVAGEVSGDMYGGRLATALREVAPAARLYGIGGDSMKEAGVDLLTHICELSVMGIWEVLRDVRRLRQILGKAKDNLRDSRPDGLVLIDFYRFNIELARVASSLGIPVVYYVAPKVWVWGRGRIRQLKEHVDHILAIFPFEEEFFRSRGMPVSYVGNPLTELLHDHRHPGPPLPGRKEGEIVISILPGSRTSEVRYLLPPFLGAARLISRQHDGPVRFVLPLPQTISRAPVEDLVKNAGVEVAIVEGWAREVLALSDLALVASGTATLEAFLLGTPQVVAYRTSWLTFFLGKRLIKIDRFSLPNILSGRAVVEELLQDEVVPERLARSALKLLEHDSASRVQYLEAGREVLKALRGGEASRLAADRILDIAAGRVP